MSFLDFICVGFQRCGTTTLYELLVKHPQIALCHDVKEPMYYRVPLLRSIGGLKYYKKRYYGDFIDDETHVRGEINAGLAFKGCAKKLGKDFAPDLKLIFILREPTARTYSAYKYFMARGFLPRSAIKNDEKYGHARGFDMYVHSILDDERKRSKIMKRRMKYLVFSQSHYTECIEEYLRYFPRENMKFVLHEDFINDQQKTCKELYDFLEIDDSKDVPYGIHLNESDERTKSYIHSRHFLFGKGFFNYFLYEFVAFSRWWPKMGERVWKRYRMLHKSCMKPDTDKDLMLPETYEYLRNYYDESIGLLEELTGMPLMKLWYEDESLIRADLS